jgi:hypothetical protein
MWLRHWKLREDPFADRPARFVPLATHREAVARLVHLVESGERVVPLRAWEGLGKTTVLVEALKRLRTPLRRVALATEPADESGLCRALLEGLRLPSHDSGRGMADAARLARVEGRGLVLAVDGDQDLGEPSWARRLSRLDPHPAGRVTVIACGPPREEAAGAWSLAVDLPPLTFSESRQLIAGRGAEDLFEAGAIEAMHHLAMGVPKGLVRLARLGLVAGAGRGIGRVTAGLIEGVAGELAGTALGGAGGVVLQSNHAISRPARLG